MKTYFSSKLFLALALVAVGATEQLPASSSSSEVDDVAALLGGLTMQMSEVPEGDLASLEDLCLQAEPILALCGLELRTAHAYLAGKTF